MISIRSRLKKILSGTLLTIFLIYSCTRSLEPKSGLTPDTLIYQCFPDKIIQLDYNTEDTGIDIPDNLIIRPGKYKISGCTFMTVGEGLLRIALIGKENHQRIVFQNDTLALLSALSWMVTHGPSDNIKTYKELNHTALSSKLYLTCGPISNWACSILSNFKIIAREVMTLTLGTWNNYDNGHNMIEVFIQGKWCLIDLDNNVYFTKSGLNLDLREFAEAVRDNSYDLNFLSEDIKIQSGGKNPLEYDFTLYHEFNTSGNDALKRWYSKVINVILIERDSMFYFPETADQVVNSRIVSYSKNIRSLNSAQFNNMFYPAKHIN